MQLVAYVLQLPSGSHWFSKGSSWAFLNASETGPAASSDWSIGSTHVCRRTGVWRVHGCNCSVCRMWRSFALTACFTILYTSAVQSCKTDCCVCSGFLYIPAFLQVPFVYQISALSCHCLTTSHKFSEDLHWPWWTLVEKKTMQSCVSGHFHFTHVVPQVALLHVSMVPPI